MTRRRQEERSLAVRGLLIASLLLVLGGATPGQPGQNPRFFPDDPIWEDPDRQVSIAQPTSRELSKTVDLFQKTFAPPVSGNVRAVNVNTLGEVPDSSWFENRMSRRVMSIDEIVRGPDRGDGPDHSVPWRIIQAKVEGTTPGFMIRDGRGDVYLIKIDPMHFPGLATGAEVIGTKFYHAFGYHVPENYLTSWEPDFYTIEPDTEVIWPDGHHAILGPRYVTDILREAGKNEDGSIPVVASKLLPGVPIGPFDFQGTRRDDPNDIFPHEDRRELRGLRIFDSWLNHNDSDSVNSLDMFYTDDDGASYVMHHRLDFGTVLGSGASTLKSHRAGNEYYFDFAQQFKAGYTFGFWTKPWIKVRYPDYPEVGRFESEFFHPPDWKADYPNPAFDKMTLPDALWATRTVMRFSDEAIRAIVGTANMRDSAAEAYLVAALIGRRDKIVDYWLSRINPIDGFRIEGTGDRRALVFTNLGADAGLADAADCSYGYAWHTFGNETGVVQAIDRPALSPAPRILVPRTDADYLLVKLSSSCPGQPAWTSEVDVYVRMNSMQVVGVERHEPQPGSSR